LHIRMQKCSQRILFPASFSYFSACEWKKEAETGFLPFFFLLC
jgi:hypothetical protein